MLGLVVCDVKDHVTEFAFVPQIDRILSTDRSVLFHWAAAFRIRRVPSQPSICFVESYCARKRKSPFRFEAAEDCLLHCSRTLCNARPTFEAIITRRRSRRPIFQPKRQKAIPTSMKQAMLSTPCTICPPSVLKKAPLLSPTNPVIAPRIMVAPSKRKGIARPRYSQDTVILWWLLAETASLVPKAANSH
jgi:hypothetical protein